MCGVWVCSLSNKVGPQEIPADGKYHLLRFPYGKHESSDPHHMHQTEQPDGAVSQFPDDRSGLIWPARFGWGTLTSVIHWADGLYTLTKDRFVRDPLELYKAVDSTATQSHSHPLMWGMPHIPDLPWSGTKDKKTGIMSTGPQYVHGTHEMYVHPGVPLGVMVMHNGVSPVEVTHAQFKLSIKPVQEPRIVSF